MVRGRVKGRRDGVDRNKHRQGVCTRDRVDTVGISDGSGRIGE